MHRAHLIPDLDFDLRASLTLPQYKTFVAARRKLLLDRLNNIFSIAAA